MIERSFDAVDFVSFFENEGDIFGIVHVELFDEFVELRLGSKLIFFIANVGHDSFATELRELRSDGLHFFPPAGPVPASDR